MKGLFMGWKLLSAFLFLGWLKDGRDLTTCKTELEELKGRLDTLEKQKK